MASWVVFQYDLVQGDDAGKGDMYQLACRFPRQLSKSIWRHLDLASKAVASFNGPLAVMVASFSCRQRCPVRNPVR